MSQFLGEFAVGQAVEVTITVKDNDGVLADADEVTLRVLHPDRETIDTLTLSGTTITHDSLGTYTATIVPNVSGKWKLKAETDGNLLSASPDGYLMAQPTAFA